MKEVAFLIIVIFLSTKTLLLIKKEKYTKSFACNSLINCWDNLHIGVFKVISIPFSHRWIVISIWITSSFDLFFDQKISSQICGKNPQICKLFSFSVTTLTFFNGNNNSITSAGYIISLLFVNKNKSFDGINKFKVYKKNIIKNFKSILFFTVSSQL